MKAYMKQSEKLYRHKAEQLTIKKTPLELANDQIIALEVKIKRRDHLITELRKNLALELLQVTFCDEYFLILLLLIVKL